MAGPIASPSAEINALSGQNFCSQSRSRPTEAEEHYAISPQTFSALRLALQYKAVQLLEPPRSEPNEEAVRKRLHKQRDHLFTFLDHDGVEATNNLAERQLRPAVIARKTPSAVISG